MSDFKSIDSSRTMENFRAARSFNDLVLTLSAIKNAAESINNRLQKKSASAKIILQDLRTLEEFSYSIQYAKTLNIITVDAKQEKFKTLSNAVENIVNTTISKAYFAINEMGEADEPETLKSLSSLVQTYITKTLNVRKYTSIVVPRENCNFTHYFILFNIPKADGFILNEFIVALDYEKLDGVEHTSVSFPAKMLFDAEPYIITKRNLISTINSCLSSDVIGILNINNRQKSTINSIENVHATYIQDDSLCVELAPSVTPAEINGVLTKLLPIVHIALNITDPRRDIIHRVSITENGNRVIKIKLMDRNFYEGKALRDLKRSLNLSNETYKTLLQIAGL